MHCQSNMIPVAEAASMMETTEINILIHINRGLLSGEECEDGWFINADSLKKLMNSSGKSEMVMKSHCGSCSSCG